MDILLIAQSQFELLKPHPWRQRNPSPTAAKRLLPVVSHGIVKVKIIGPKPSSQRFHPPTRFGEDGQLVHEKAIRQAMMKAPDSTCDSLPKALVSNSDGEGMPNLQVCDGARHSLALYHQGNERKPSTSSNSDEEDLPILKVCDDAEQSFTLYHQGNKRKASIPPSWPAEIPKMAKKRRTNSARAGSSWITTSHLDVLENACVPENAHNTLTSSRTVRQVRRFEKKTPLIHLSSEEIEWDFQLILGQQRPRRQAKRPRKVQENIKLSTTILMPSAEINGSNKKRGNLNHFPGMNLTRSIDLKQYN